MFGYVKPEIPELVVKEYEFYKEAYCGLCRELKKISRIMPFTLSYDFVFLALVRSLAHPECTFERGRSRCAARPFAKHGYVTNDCIKYAARASVILTTYKFYDDCKDSKGIKKLFCYINYKIMKKKLKKLPEEELKQSCLSNLEKLSEIENSLCDSVYDGAEVFGDLLADFFSYGEDGNTRKAMHKIGLSVGKWIYILDAAADVKEDLRSGSYNPFIESGIPTYTDEFKQDIINAQKLELASAEECFKYLANGKYPQKDGELPADKGIASIIYNIIYLGMPNTAKQVIIENKKIKKSKELPS